MLEHLQLHTFLVDSSVTKIKSTRGHGNFVHTLYPAPGGRRATVRVIYWMCVWQLHFPSAQEHFEQPAKEMCNLNVSLLKNKTKNQAKKTNKSKKTTAKPKQKASGINLPEREKKSGNEGVRVSVRFFWGAQGDIQTFVNQNNNEWTKRKPPKVLIHQKQTHDCFPLPVPPVCSANRSPHF